MFAGRYAPIPHMPREEMPRRLVADQTKAISEWTVLGTRDGMAFAYLGCDLSEFRDGYFTKKDTR